MINQSGEDLADSHFVAAHQPDAICAGAPVGILDDPLRDLARITPTEAKTALSVRYERPQRIALYEVLDELTATRFGRVFRVQRHGTARQWILLLSSRRLDNDPAALERLRRSFRELTGCIHPNLVRIIDLDCHDGRPFVVMEQVYGLTLKRFALERRPEPRETASAVADLAGALTYLQSRGINQAEVDPGDVVIDETGRPRLRAFGLADLGFHNCGAVERGPGDQEEERCAVAQEPIKQPSSVRGLGEVLYYLLTCRPPLAVASSSLAFAQAETRSVVPPRRFNPRVPRCLERISLRALAPSEEQRFRGARELEDALRQFLARRWIGLAGLVAVSLPILVFLVRRLSTGGY
jgi:eukaryotic-like serine/threonine-protein kinase